MRILVRAHSLRIGGSQINAIDLAGAVRDLGHDVVVYAEPGPLEDRIQQRALPFVAAGNGAPRSVRAIAEFARVAKSVRPDLIHTYEYYPTLESFYGPHGVLGVPMVATILSMSVPPFLPRSIPLIVGTEALARESRRTWRAPVLVVEPPIDTREDTPEMRGSMTESFKGHLGIDGLPIVVIVSRLSWEMKMEGVEAAIEAIASLYPRFPARLVVVGAGNALDALTARARAVNDRLGNNAIVVVGPMLDPRPAYAMADVVVGMGSSAIRGMAFAKPVVVIGEQGFCEVVSPATIGRFLTDGFYGVGNGESAAPALAPHLERLFSDPEQRKALGQFGVALVRERYDLAIAARRIEYFYRAMVTRGANFGGLIEDTVAIGLRIGWEATRVLAGRCKGRLGVEQ